MIAQHEQSYGQALYIYLTYAALHYFNIIVQICYFESRLLLSA